MQITAHPRTTLRQPRKTAGITLLEVLISLSIIAMATVGLNMLADRFSEDTREMVTAGQLRTFGEAAKAYIKDNYAAVQATASPTVPYLVSAGMLVASGRLPVGYQAKNAHEQSICALVLEPTPGQLQALVVTEGGKNIGDPSLGTIAATVGGSGGAIYATNAASVAGASGAWTLPVANFDNLVNQLSQHCDGTAGNVRLQAGHSVMALWFENGDTSSAFVARDAVPGRPELNAMNTPLVMNSVQTVGAACAAGGIARDATGGLLTCRSGAWAAPASSSGCEATTSDLNNLQTDGRCYNGVNLPNSPGGAEWVFVEVYRHVNTTTYNLAQRVVGMTGATVGKVWQRNQVSGTQTGGWTAWVQQADPGVSVAGGGVTATGTVQGSYLYSTGNVNAAGSVSATGNVNATLDVITNRNLGVYNGSGYYVSDTWAALTYARDGGMYSEPTSARGSLHVNDVYLRSKGNWLSQISGLNQNSCGWIGVPGGGNGAVGNFAAVCPWGYYMAGYQNYRDNDWTRTGYAVILCCYAG